MILLFFIYHISTHSIYHARGTVDTLINYTVLKIQ